MNLKSLLATAAFLLPMAASAQSITPAQIEQFKSLPQAQQEALARQYGVDLDSLQAGNLQNQRPQEIDVVRPANGNQQGETGQNGTGDEEQNRQISEKGGEEPGGLKPFGYNLFAGEPTTFAPVTEIPVPSEYTLGPGDVLRVQLWGNQKKQLELPVSRDGTIDFPERGPVSVAGQNFQQVRDQLTQLVSEQYIGVKAAVSLGELRSMRVFILGEARTPGSYSVSSLSTITNALYVSGGIKNTGSLRNVQHKRDGKLIGTLDLYDLLLKGDTSDDARLQAGDVIFIPPVGPRAGIGGEVYRPALYEIGTQTSLQELVRLAGGLTPQAYPQITKIERTNEDYLRIIAEADLTQATGKNARVQSGDRVTVASIADVTGQYIEIKGAATRTGKYAWVPGMRVSSVIRNLDAGLLSFADTNYAAIVRTDPETHRISVLNLELKAAVTQPGSPEDLILQEKDQLLFFTNAGKVSFELDIT